MRIVDSIEQQISQSEEGSLFFVSDFATSGNDVFISRLLSGFADSGLLCRLSKGIYYKPIRTRLGILYPEIPEIVKAIVRRDNAQILPTGETAQNILGLSTQMPLNYVYLTSGSARKLSIGTKTITFKRCVPKIFSCRNEFMAILIQAMKSIGQDRLTDAHKATIRGLLQNNMPIESFEEDLKTAPVWARRVISIIVKEIENEKMD